MLKTYFFHLMDGSDVLLDPEGRVPSIEAVAAAAAALFEARSIICADVRLGKIALNQRIDVEDDKGCVVHSLKFEDAVLMEPHAAGPTVLT